MQGFAVDAKDVVNAELAFVEFGIPIQKGLVFCSEFELSMTLRRAVLDYPTSEEEEVQMQILAEQMDSIASYIWVRDSK